MKRKIFSLLFVIVFSFLFIVPVFSSDLDDLSVDTPLLIDSANLLDDFEESDILSQLEEISERQGMDVVIITTNSLEGYSPMEYADDFYDYHGYRDDGILLLISMEARDWWISTSGFGITAFTDAGIEYISEELLNFLSDDMFYFAFDSYASLCDDFITQAKTGEPYDYNNLPKDVFDLVIYFLISLVIGFIVAFIATAVMKHKLKSVYSKTEAHEYIKDGSMNITRSRDIFLYRNIRRTSKPKNTSSSTHTSSSGRSHGGSGGKF
ncbi:MAG: TPM domain-containing protein [Ruminococcaceae bacterium]|nr:TPM domain-containing protein [Oscillospiraceae bacterium]